MKKKTITIEILEQVNNYYPYGGLMASSSSIATPSSSYPANQPYRYNGKELDRKNGLDWMDYGARHFAGHGQWTSPDPLAEKYYDWSPYVYCIGNPIKFIDPDGRLVGDYLTTNGDFIASDGINDGKIYVLKTYLKPHSFDSKGKVPVAGISKSEAKRVIRERDISNKNNFVEVDGTQEIRSEAVSLISDDGNGGTSDNNNREYLITFERGNNKSKVYLTAVGEVGDPSKDDNLSVQTGTSPDIVYLHPHPSGNKDKSMWRQAPSLEDIENAVGINYVIGMRDKTVYIYNNTGILATLPLGVYTNYK